MTSWERLKELTEIVTPKVNGKYGAPMGRYDVFDLKNGDELTFYIRRIRLDKQGYDIGGAYWGLGDKLYVNYTPCGKYKEYYRSRIKPRYTIRKVAKINNQIYIGELV